MDRIRQLEIFKAAAELGSLAAAGRALGLSPAMTGKYLGALETTLGVQLIRRTTRSLSLTAAGAKYLSASKRIIEAMDEADAGARGARAQLAGPIRMSAPRTFGLLRLAPILVTFCQAHRGITLDVYADERYADLVEDRLDIAVRIGRLANSTLHARRMGRIDMGMFCSPTLLDAGARRDPAKVRRLPRLVFTAARSPGDWLATDDRGNIHAVDGPAVMRSDDMTLLVRAAIDGIGILYAPAFAVAEPLKQGQLMRVLDDCRMAKLDLQVVYVDRRYQPARVRALIDHLAGELARRSLAGSLR